MVRKTQIKLVVEFKLGRTKQFSNLRPHFRFQRLVIQKQKNARVGVKHSYIKITLIVLSQYHDNNRAVILTNNYIIRT